jgi:hypothetical protein
LWWEYVVDFPTLVQKFAIESNKYVETSPVRAVHLQFLFYLSPGAGEGTV